MSGKSPRWHLIVVAAAAVLVYANALGNAFVGGDLHFIVDNPAIKDARGVWTLRASDLYPQLGSHYYRPLQALSYWLDHQVWTLAPAGYHLTSALPLYRLVARLLGCPGPR